MISKQQFIDSCLKEIKIFKHLYEKVNPDKLDFKPTEKQRSTRQLLQFIMHSFQIELEGIKLGQIRDFKKMAEQSAQTPVEKFPQKMDELAGQIKNIVGNFSQQELDEQIDLFGRGMAQSRVLWLLELILKNMVGYKMQLFLYIKQSGNTEIGTRNVWHGEDPKK